MLTLSACGSRAEDAGPGSDALASVDVRVRWVVGEPDGGVGKTFGWVTDVEVDGAGNLFVLDEQARRVEVFAPAGRYLGLAGGPGEGPGELGAPTDLMARPDGSVEVLDPALGRIARYSVIGDAPTFLGSARNEARAISACSSGADRVLYTPQAADGHLLRLLGPEGDLSEGVGLPYSEELPPELAPYRAPVLGSYNRARLLCPTSGPWVVALLEGVPLVRAFDARGVIRWEHRLGGFTRTRHQARPGGGVRVMRDPIDGPLYYGAGIALVAHDTLAVSVGTEGVESEDPEHPYEVRLLSLSTGQELHRVRIAFPIMVVRGDEAYGARSHPYPRVVAFAWRDLLKASTPVGASPS